MAINPHSKDRLRQDRRTYGIVPGNFRQTIGSNTSTAITQRQKVNASGGTIS